LKEKGMTQRQLAEKLGVSEVTVSRWMTDGANGRNPSVQTLQKIADVLETTPNYLMGTELQENKTSTSSGDSVNWGAILAGTALTATAVIGLVALAKAMGKLNESDKEQIENILNRE
ncbi:MAG: helix-turn-helix domain-containing protein, partial [Treponema sp.]|nr:helix-turn-helix domain-containing protein [Treponema sp.]